MPIINRIAAYQPDMAEWRRDIHRHPELAYQENRTAAKVAAMLREFGFDEVEEGIGKTGVVGVLRNGDGPRIGLRADMDALPLHEISDKPYKSVHDGVMHACGHDGHTAMLLGAARYLAENRNFKGTTVFVFQPAEEGAAGARAMIEDGLFDRYPVDFIYGVHNMPGLPAGKIAIGAGPIMAAADSFEVIVQGRGGHGAMPQSTADPVVAASAMVMALQTIASRNLDPVKTLVISVTQFHGGDAFNVIPDTVKLGGTVRYFEPEIGALTKRRMREVLDGVAAAYGVSATLNYSEGYPPTINHAESAAFAQSVATDVAGDAQVLCEQPAVMGSEDFSFFLQVKPGAYAWIGNGEGEGCHHLHNPHYDFNDDIMPIGASYFSRLVETALPKG
ncbi:MAG: amidohydrolase [Rhodospirillaceae bacterium]|nr:amidohydrolase [Rhodospirillaceae bacterium]